MEEFFIMADDVNLKVDLISKQTTITEYFKATLWVFSDRSFYMQFYLFNCMILNPV